MAHQAHILGKDVIGFSSDAAGNECHKALAGILNDIGRSTLVLEVSGIQPPKESISAVHVGSKRPLDEEALWIAQSALEGMDLEVIDDFTEAA